MSIIASTVISTGYHLPVCHCEADEQDMTEAWSSSVAEKGMQISFFSERHTRKGQRSPRERGSPLRSHNDEALCPQQTESFQVWRVLSWTGKKTAVGGAAITARREVVHANDG